MFTFKLTPVSETAMNSYCHACSLSNWTLVRMSPVDWSMLKSLSTEPLELLDDDDERALMLLLFTDSPESDAATGTIRKGGTIIDAPSPSP